jgi:hypothetical protein
VFASVWSWLEGVEADEWSAAAAWCTLLVALLAARVAYSQLREAARLRREQAQPYVVVFMEPSVADQVHVDLVLKNLGATAALDVRLTIDPAPVRAEQEGLAEELRLPASLPVIVPGQEWRTFWDSIHRRGDSGLPDSHEAIVAFSDSTGKRHEYRFVLDWGPVNQRGYLVTYNVHHVAKALREIRTEVKNWRDGGKGVVVWARDGEARQERLRQQLANHRGDVGGVDQDGHRWVGRASKVLARIRQLLQVA